MPAALTAAFAARAQAEPVVWIVAGRSHDVRTLNDAIDALVLL